jgi:hypothetical protein
MEVLALLATGRSNQQIAEELAVALETVKSVSQCPGQARRGQPHPDHGPRPGIAAAPVARARLQFR